MRYTHFFLLTAAAAACILTVAACNLGLGTDGGGGSGGSGGGSPAGRAAFESLVQEQMEGLPSDPSPEQVFEAGTTLKDRQIEYGIETATAVAVIEEMVEQRSVEEALQGILEDGYVLQDVQSAMNGITEDPEQNIEAALSLDENIDEDSVAQLEGDVEWVDGKKGSAVRFDSEGEYIDIPDADNLDLTGEESAVEVWIYPENNIDAAGILHKGVEKDFSDESYSLQYNRAGELAMIFTNTDGTHTYVISGEERLAENQWHHIVVSWTHDEVWMYVNGEQVTDFLYYQNKWKSSLPQNFAPIRDSDGNLMIGSQPVLGYRFEGIIDEVVLYDRLLTGEEVSERYENP